MGHSPAESILNWASTLSVLGAIVGYLPAASAGLGAIWFAWQIYDRYKYGPKR